MVKRRNIFVYILLKYKPWNHGTKIYLVGMRIVNHEVAYWNAIVFTYRKWHKEEFAFPNVTCLLRILSSPDVSPVSVFCVATGISSLSFTGGISPFAKDRKYLDNEGNINHFVYTKKYISHDMSGFKSFMFTLAYTYAADHANTSFGCVRMADFVNCLRMSGSSGGIWICWEQ